MTVRARCRRNLVAGALAGIASLAASAYAAAMATDNRILLASKPAMTVPIPAALLPTGTSIPVLPAPLTADQRVRLRRALWRDPLDQALVNLLYVEAVRSRGAGTATLSGARTLARLGWRHTPAQQNLMLRAAVDNRFGEVIDRADGLLRRQKLTDQAITMLVAMEALPQVNRLIIDKLRGNPNWRYGYLLRIARQTPVQILDARTSTLRVLLRQRENVSRAELAPTIRALVANGRAQSAYDLWTMKAGRSDGGNLLRDPRFRAAMIQRDAGDVDIPFEWHFGQGLGYSAGSSPQGATITWDGRGVPVLLSQLVPVRPGRSYLLTIEGRADGAVLLSLLAPALGCGQADIAFAPVGATGTGAARFRSPVLPAGCDMADLTIAGDVDARTRGTTINIGRVVLQSAG